MVRNMAYDPMIYAGSNAVAAGWHRHQELKKNALAAEDKVSNGERDNRRLRQACQQFESMFLAMMLKEMRQTVPHDGLLKKSNADDIYQSLFDSQLADLLARREATGLTEFFYQQLA